MICLFPMLIHWRVRKPSCGPGVLNHCRCWGEGLNPVRLVWTPGLLLTVLGRCSVACRVCVYMVFSNIVNGITVAHYASRLVVVCDME